MDRLVLQEIKGSFMGNYKTEAGKVMGTLASCICYVIILLVLFGSDGARGFMMMFMVTCIGELTIKKSPSAAMYMIPGTVREYAYAKFRCVTIMEIAIYVIGTVGQCIALYCINDTEALCRLTDINILLTFIGFLIYAVIKNIWLLYMTYTDKRLYKEKYAQGKACFFYLVIDLLIDIVEMENVMHMYLFKCSLLIAFAAYAVYICNFVGKNILIASCRIENSVAKEDEIL